MQIIFSSRIFAYKRICPHDSIQRNSLAAAKITKAKFNFVWRGNSDKNSIGSYLYAIGSYLYAIRSYLYAIRSYLYAIRSYLNAIRSYLNAIRSYLSPCYRPL